ncbi:hypothetical protein ILUMI_09450 [Ignelater luminosus]|uniref:Uncharacterized protein n=1 Tax=Ignelater luminosus TaxID=2038154 RepID=A0A8K0GCF0_IGNLU|nr:hypothetical protein ILUMI_09450 [Ignelater luminosus]
MENKLNKIEKTKKNFGTMRKIDGKKLFAQKVKETVETTVNLKVTQQLNSIFIAIGCICITKETDVEEAIGDEVREVKLMKINFKIKMDANLIKGSCSNIKIGLTSCRTQEMYTLRKVYEDYMYARNISLSSNCF